MNVEWWSYAYGASALWSLFTCDVMLFGQISIPCVADLESTSMQLNLLLRMYAGLQRKWCQQCRHLMSQLNWRAELYLIETSFAYFAAKSCRQLELAEFVTWSPDMFSGQQEDKSFWQILSNTFIASLDVSNGLQSFVSMLNCNVKDSVQSSHVVIAALCMSMSSMMQYEHDYCPGCFSFPQACQATAYLEVDFQAHTD